MCIGNGRARSKAYTVKVFGAFLYRNSAKVYFGCASSIQLTGKVHSSMTMKRVTSWSSFFVASIR